MIKALLLPVLLLLPACIFVIHDDGSMSEYHDWSTSSNMVKGSGVSLSESRVVAPFRRIAVHDAIDVRVRIGEPQSITVRADDNFVPWIETSVSGDTLTVRWAPPKKTGSSMTISPLVEIVVPALDALKLDGVGEVRVEGLAGGTLAIDTGGAGGVRASGRVDRLQLYLAGVGDADLEGLEARSADVSLTGTGDVHIDVRESLHATVTGVGDVRYRGHPKDVTKSVVGPGSVEAEHD